MTNPRLPTLAALTLLVSATTAFQPQPTTTRRSSTQLSATTNDRLAELGITLPPAPPAAANYLPCQRSGNLLFLSGHMPLLDDGTILTGTCASDDDIDEGYRAARQVGLNLIATLNDQLDGNLDRVEQIVKLFGIVQSTPDFHSQHRVLNGCSDLMAEVFGDVRGVHSRSAIGTNALPLDLMVEIEAIVRIAQE